MARLKYYMNIFFSSYTIASLIVAFINALNYSTSLGVEWIFQMALLCFTITILMFITDIVSEKFFGDIPVFVFILIGLIEVSACVLLMGGLWFEWFTLNFNWISEVIVIDTVVYFSVFVIMFFQEKKSAESINRIIKNGRNKNGKDN